MNVSRFRQLLLKWNEEQNDRQMPWKGEKDAYKVWLSEIILQQTRVEQGWAYYEKFVQHYPDIQTLAAARDEDVFKLWEGLGYYSRCRNLLVTARIIAEKYNGIFPNTYEEIIALKGIGDYTASAIASFCFNLPYAVLDGNVFRVLSRIFNVDIPTDTTQGKKYFKQLASSALSKQQPGLYNQAIMDFGATVCKPAPVCTTCFLQKICGAYAQNRMLELPVKSKSLIKKDRWFNYFVLVYKDDVLVFKRTQKDIWQNLYEFYLYETADDPLWNESAVKAWLQQNLRVIPEAIHIEKASRQILTHRLVYGYFITVNIAFKNEALIIKGEWINLKSLSDKPFPRFLHQYSNKLR